MVAQSSEIDGLHGSARPQHACAGAVQGVAGRSEIPGRNEFQSGMGEIPNVARGELAPVDAGNRRDHAVRNRHRPSGTGRFAHQCAVIEGRGFVEGEDAVGKALAPSLKARSQTRGALIPANLLDAIGDFGDRDGGKREIDVIPREPGEDAGIGRVYLPAEALQAAGITPTTPGALVTDPGLDAAARWLAPHAQNHFREAAAILAARPKGLTQAPRLMEAAYARVLARMCAAGWTAPRARVGVSKWRLALMALRLWITG